MNNRESFNSLNQETSGRFATFKERMRTMLHGSKLDEVAQTVETAIDTGVDAVLQTITWLQENYRSLFVAISPILLAACATMTDQQPVSAADIQDSLNKQRTGATLELSIEDQDALQAAPTATPAALAAVLQSGGEAKPTATPIVPEQYVDKQVVYIPAGVNIRATASTSGALVLNTKGEMRLETTGETAQANGYTWYEVSNPNYNPDDTKSLKFVWVAGGATGVKLETVRVQVGIGGGNFEGNQTYEELLALAKQQLDASVVDVKEVDGVIHAFNSNGNSIGSFANGQFYSSLPATVDGVIQEKTVLPEGSINKSEVISESITFEEFNQQYPEIAAKVTDKMAYVEIIQNGDTEISGVTYINGRTFMVNVREDGIFELTQDGEVKFVYFDVKNKDKRFNDWVKPELESEKGLFNILVSVDYHNPSQDRLLPERATNHIVDVIPASTAIIDRDETLGAMFNMKNQSSYEHLVKYGYITPDQKPGELEDPLKKLDELSMTFFDLLGISGELPSSAPIKLQDGTETSFNPQLGINFVINSVPSRDFGWLPNGEATITNWPSQPYSVGEDGALIFYLVSNYKLNSWNLNTLIPLSLKLVLKANNINFPESALNNEMVQYVAVGDGVYALPNVLMGQSEGVGKPITYYSLRVK